MKWIAIAALLALQGCAAIRGLPELPDAQKPARSVVLRLHATANLNAGKGNQPYALVVRIYKLRQLSTFQQMHFDDVLSMHRESELLGKDLLDVREVMLIPGQRYETMEKVTREAGFIGVVALFRAPAPHRWRFAVPAADAEKSGITLGLHSCAIGAGEALAQLPC
jgi:type VI secretion system protein VasD